MNTENITLALSKVIDPELHRPITDLGMVESVNVDSGIATIKILLTIAGCPMKDRLREDVVEAVSAIDEITDVNRLKGWINLIIGLTILAGMMFYLAFVSRGSRRVSVQGLRLELPGLALTLRQWALGVIDLSCAAGALFVILPQGHGLDFISFCAAYVLACLLGIASHMPGGIGAFEATMLNTVPAPSTEALLASLLLFRIIYYVGPFILALALLGANESIRRWTSLRAAMCATHEE